MRKMKIATAIFCNGGCNFAATKNRASIKAMEPFFYDGEIVSKKESLFQEKRWVYDLL
jgi:hypothetical protein